MTAANKVVQLFADDKKLCNESPLIVLPSLAVLVGLNQAIVLQQVHYRSRVCTKQISGLVYCGLSQQKLVENFPFWSQSTALRAFSDLEAIGVLVKAKKAHRAFYRVDYERLEELMAIGNEPPIEDDEEEPGHVNLTSQTCQSDKSLLYKKEGCKKGGQKSPAKPIPGEVPKKAEAVVKELASEAPLEKVAEEFRSEVNPSTTRIAQAWQMLRGMCKRLHDDKAKLPPPLTNKQMGQIGQLRKRAGADEAMMLVVGSALRWQKVAGYVKLHAGLDHVPKSPDVGFLLLYFEYVEDCLTSAGASQGPGKGPVQPKGPVKEAQGTEAATGGQKEEDELVSLDDIVKALEGNEDADG